MLHTRFLNGFKLCFVAVLGFAGGCSREVVSVDALKRGEPFSATIVDIEVLRHITWDETLILISVEKPNGQKLTIGGPTADDRMVKRVELMTIGRSYTFPDALLK